jgi:hypothetical protein
MDGDTDLGRPHYLLSAQCDTQPCDSMKLGTASVIPFVVFTAITSIL